MPATASAELMSTLPGVPFYGARGSTARGTTKVMLEGDVEIDFVPMSQVL